MSLEALKPRSMDPDRSMACPTCGRLCKPYGGFGDSMRTTGKYQCQPWAGGGRGCGQGWYGKPATWEIVDRW
jgi:hypothetical protein